MNIVLLIETLFCQQMNQVLDLNRTIAIHVTRRKRTNDNIVDS